MASVSEACQAAALDDVLKSPGRLTISTDNPAFYPWWAGEVPEGSDWADFAGYPLAQLTVLIYTGPITDIVALPATREVPKRLQHPKRRTIGLRVPDHPLVRAVLDALGEPIMSSTLLLPGDDLPLTDPLEIEERIGHEIDLIVDAGPTGIEPTSVIDISDDTVKVLRVGRGDVSAFL